MTAEKRPRRLFWAACGLTSTASLGLMVVPLLPQRSVLGDPLLFALVCVLAVLMALGSTLAVFSLKRP